MADVEGPQAQEKMTRIGSKNSASVYTLEKKKKKKVGTEPIFIRSVLKKAPMDPFLNGTGKTGMGQVSFTREIYPSPSNFYPSRSIFFSLV